MNTTLALQGAAGEVNPAIWLGLALWLGTRHRRLFAERRESEHAPLRDAIAAQPRA